MAIVMDSGGRESRADNLLRRPGAKRGNNLALGDMYVELSLQPRVPDA